MTPADFSARLADLKLSGAALARLTGQHVGTISRYRKGKTPIPPWMGLVLDTLAFCKQLQERAKK